MLHPWPTSRSTSSSFSISPLSRGWQHPTQPYSSHPYPLLLSPCPLYRGPSPCTPYCSHPISDAAPPARSVCGARADARCRMPWARPEGGGGCSTRALRDTSHLVLLLCDNEAVLCVIKKWVGQGGKATLATTPDANILAKIVCILTRVRAGRATFLVKVKSHRGEPINEVVDTLRKSDGNFR